jgi:chemotaxis protein MotB
MQRILMRGVGVLLLVGCGIPKEQYDAKALQAEQLSKQYQDEQGKAAALEAKVKELQAKNAELQKGTETLSVAKQEAEKKSSEYEGLASSLKNEIESGKIELSELKGKMTVKMQDKILFPSGSAHVSKDGKEALNKVADALKNLKGKIVRVEGHTDDVPTGKGPYPSNWELSTARALAVVKYFQDQGVDPSGLSAAGYGQYHPLVPNDSPTSRAQNRRIEIVLAAPE